MNTQTEPHDNAAEQAVLGALMLKPAAFWRISDRLKAEDFYHPAHVELFAAMAELCKANQPCDMVTLGDALERAGRIDVAGGIGYILEIEKATPGAANIVAHAEIVAAKSEVRRVRAAGREIAQIDGGDSPSSNASALLASAARPTVHSIQPIGDVLKSWYANFVARFERTGELPGVPTGLANLDALTGGWQPGNLVILAARPSMGKTACALMFARAAAEAGHGVLIFTIEMSSDQLMSRMVSAVASIDSDLIRNPRDMDEEAWPRVSAAVQHFQQLPIAFDQSSPVTKDTLSAKARQAHARKPVRLIVIDYLQLMTPPRAESLNVAMGEITREMKSLAKALDATVIVLSQLNRKCEERTDKRPMMSDLRDSGAIEQDADLIVFLYRDEQYDANTVDKGCIEIIVKKQRDGRIGTVPARADLRFGRFAPIDQLPSANQSDAPPAPRAGFRQYAKPRAVS